MHIERGLFLTLTFGMAGAACNMGASPPATTVDIPRQPGSTANVPTPANDPPPAVGVPNDAEEDPGAPFEEEGGDDETTDNGCGRVDGATVKRAAGRCNDDQGTAVACATMKTCQGYAFPREHCELYRKFFKAKVAQKAVECLAKLSQAEVCDGCPVYKCGDIALKGSCPDSTAEASCVRITAACPKASPVTCERYLAGMNPAGRARVVACMTGPNGCAFGLYSCVESL